MEINKSVSKEKAAEFLKPMKHYEYNVVEQLKKICQDISNVFYPELRAPPQCITKSVEQGICAPRHGPKNYKAFGQKNICNKLPILH